MAFLALVVVVLAGVPSPSLTWSVSSPSAAARLSQKGVTEDTCTLECEVSGKPAWTAQLCLGRGTDFAFVSNDCGSTVVLYEYPLKTGTPESTVVATTMSGNAGLRSFRLGELRAPSRGEGKRVRWLGGVVGEPGVRPHLSASETQIEFMTLDGQARSVRFGTPDDLVPRPAGPTAGSEVSAASTSGMYQFTDDEGSTQFVMGLSQVPKKFRKRARPVESEVGVVQGAQNPRGARVPSSAPSSDAVGSRLERRPQSAPQQIIVSPPPRPKAPECQIFGLPGPACQAVQEAERQRVR